MIHIGLGWTRYERGDGLQAALSEFQGAINAPESKGNAQLALAQALMRLNGLPRACLANVNEVQY